VPWVLAMPDHHDQSGGDFLIFSVSRTTEAYAFDNASDTSFLIE
jgi:hypothetical protein